MKTDSRLKMHSEISGRFLITLLSIFFLLSFSVNGQKGNLVSVEWLSKNLGNKGIVILDANPVQVYKAGHIPGALNYDLFTYGPRELPVSEFEKRLQSWGISEGNKVVIYDQGGTMMATFLLVTLDYYGFPVSDIYVLDGGLSKWKEQGHSLTADASPVPVKGSFKIKELNTGIKAGLPEFLNASGDRANNTLLEALDPAWHYGSVNIFGKIGHVPGAIMLPVADFFNPDKTFKSNDELVKVLDYLGIDSDRNIYTHCGGGIAASVPYFALKYLLGWTDVKLFQGSQLEWASDIRELPFWTYDAPYLIRDAGWLQGWNGRMMRMYGMSNLTLVDLRSPDAFREGHLEYAVNLSPDELLRNISNQDKMADLLSLTGVNATTEAVIITGGRLSKEAALAFVALKKAGLKKVSVFMDPYEKWESSGFTIVKESKNEAVVTKSNPDSYRVDSETGIIITDLKTEKGNFPTVVIDCGEKQSGTNHDLRTIHLPYTSLLADDGTPRSAGEIWNILMKAEVPRYARLVCYSDDPGEAAVIYFTLELMGLPDVKILLPSN